MAAADVDELDPRLGWRVLPRDQYTGPEEAFRLVGRTQEREIDLLAIADKLGVVWNRPTSPVAQTQSVRRLAGQGVNRSGHRYRFVLERHIQSRHLRQDSVEVIRVMTQGVPRRGSAERTVLLRRRAARLVRMRLAGLIVVRTETLEEDANHYRIIDHLRARTLGAKSLQAPDGGGE